MQNEKRKAMRKKMKASSTITKEIGARIRMLRLKEDVTQAVIAERLKMSIPAYSKMESGVTDMNIKALEMIARTFDVPLTDLIDDRVKDNAHAALQNTVDDQKQIINKQLEEINKLQGLLIDALMSKTNG